MKLLLSIGLGLLCLIAGYGFYKVNRGDVISSVAFTVGLLGILASFVRNLK